MTATSVTARQVKDGTLTSADFAAAYIDGVAANASVRTLGTGSQQACAGNDARLSDARTPVGTALTTNKIWGGRSSVAAEISVLGTTNQVTVTHNSGDVTFSLPQSIHTAATPQFAKIGIGAAAHATSKIYVTDASSNVLLVETTGSTSQAGLKCSLMNGASAIRAFTFSIRGDLDAAGSFCISDETAGAVRMSMDQNGWMGVGGIGLARIHAIENTATATTRGIISENFIGGTGGGNFVGRKARVSGGSRIAVTTGDRLAEWWAQGHDGTSFVDSAKIVMVSTGTIGTGRMPSQIIFYTGTDVATTVVTEVCRLTEAQELQMAEASNLKTGTTTGSKICTATGQKLAFWNKTPIVQPTTGITGATLAGGGGTTLTSTHTFGGYTMQQIAAALINVGLLA